MPFEGVTAYTDVILSEIHATHSSTTQVRTLSDATDVRDLHHCFKNPCCNMCGQRIPKPARFSVPTMTFECPYPDPNDRMLLSSLLSLACPLERLSVSAWMINGVTPSDIEHLAYSITLSHFLTSDVHKPGRPRARYLVVVANDVVDYVEAKYKSTPETYWKCAAERRKVLRP
jgi:hypothetical protein